MVNAKLPFWLHSRSANTISCPLGHPLNTFISIECSAKHTVHTILIYQSYSDSILFTQTHSIYIYIYMIFLNTPLTFHMYSLRYFTNKPIKLLPLAVSTCLIAHFSIAWWFSCTSVRAKSYHLCVLSSLWIYDVSNVMHEIYVKLPNARFIMCVFDVIYSRVKMHYIEYSLACFWFCISPN